MRIAMKCEYKNCGHEMKIERMDKDGYPRTYRCNLCQSFTIVEKSGLTKRYDPNGKLFTAKPETLN